MEAANLLIVSWRIENLSCWNQALHGKCIESGEIHFVPPDLEMMLYPRGTSGLEENMVVHFSIADTEDEFSGDLYFIGADGSTLCTQRVHSIRDESDLKLPPGPIFEDVIAKSRKIGKDQLTLQFQVKSNKYDEYHLCTKIQVFDVTLAVDRNKILEDDKIILYIRFTHDDYGTEIDLKTGQIREDKKIELCLDTKETSFSVKTHLRLVSSVGSLIRCENNEHLFHEGQPWTFCDSLSKEELSENVGTIILLLKIISGKISNTLRNVFSYCGDVKIVPKSPKTHDAIAYNDQENTVGVLSKDLKCLYQDKDFSDLQLKCESVTFPVHRNILSARSPVFKTMLSSDMREAASGCVDIVDLDACTLSRFLTFLYTGAVEDLQGSESAFKLYNAADKYKVPSLKRVCVNFLGANTSVSNVCEVLSLGHKQEDDELTAAARNFILKNCYEVLKSSEWSSFMRSEPLLAAETLTHFAAKGFIVAVKYP